MSDIVKKTNLNSPSFTFHNKFERMLWIFSYYIFFRFSPISLFRYRVFLLRLFKCQISYSSRIYPSVKIWLPRNLQIGENSTIGPHTKIYNQGKITIFNRVIISQGAHLCASTHDYTNPTHPLLLAPITVENEVWLCADSFVGPYVIVKEGTVLGARSALFSTTESWSVYLGNPASYVKPRYIRDI